jgi:hypothetical protein
MIQGADGEIVLAASRDASSLQLISEGLLCIICRLQRQSIALLECLRRRTSFLDFVCLPTCSDWNGLSDSLQTFVLLLKLMPQFVTSDWLSERLSAIIYTIIPAPLSSSFFPEHLELHCRAHQKFEWSN